MALFQTAYLETLGNEGRVLETVSGDRGGETYCGVSRVNHPTWPGWALIDAARTRHDFPACLSKDPALEAELVSFYKGVFWDSFHGDQVTDQVIANRLFDASVNLGGIELDFLQEGLNLLSVDSQLRQLYPEIAEDGHPGAATMGALGACLGRGDGSHLLQILELLQGSRYVDICRKRPDQRKFLRGWLNRDFKEA